MTIVANRNIASLEADVKMRIGKVWGGGGALDGFNIIWKSTLPDIKQDFVEAASATVLVYDSGS